jgi:hypothetical protein
MEVQRAFNIDSMEFDSMSINAINVTSHLDVRYIYSFNTYTKCKKFYVSSYMPKLRFFMCCTIIKYL